MTHLSSQKQEDPKLRQSTNHHKPPNEDFVVQQQQQQQQQQEELLSQSSSVSNTTEVNNQQEQPEDKGSSGAGCDFYVSRKPLWWRRQAGKKPSKARRRLLNDPTLQSMYLLQRSEKYGDELCWEKIFSNKNPASTRPRIWLEIGFGQGDNLLRLAEQYNSEKYCFVGSEVHAGGTAMVLHRIVQLQQQQQEQALESITLWKPGMEQESHRQRLQADADADADVHNNDVTMASYPVNEHHDAASTASTLSSSVSSWSSSQCPQPFSNLRLHSGDGVKLLLRIPSHSMDAVLVTFPDPFFDDYCENEQDRRDHQDHHYTECRLLQLNVLAQIWRVLVASSTTSSSSSLSTPSTSGRLYLATDHSGYHAWSHQQVERFNRQKLQQQLLHGSQSRGRSTTGSNNDPISNTKTTGVAHFALIHPTPDRRQWLPVISKYEQKGWNEGRSTHLSCWEATTTLECEH